MKNAAAGHSGIGALGHVLDVAGLDLAGQRGLDGLASVFVLAHPPGIGDRGDIDEADLQRIGLRRGLGKSWKKETSGRERGCEVFIHGSPLHGPGIKNVSAPGQHADEGILRERVLHALQARTLTGAIPVH